MAIVTLCLISLRKRYVLAHWHCPMDMLCINATLPRILLASPPPRTPMRERSLQIVMFTNSHNITAEWMVVHRLANRVPKHVQQIYTLYMYIDINMQCVICCDAQECASIENSLYGRRHGLVRSRLMWRTGLRLRSRTHDQVIIIITRRLANMPSAIW